MNEVVKILFINLMGNNKTPKQMLDTIVAVRDSWDGIANSDNYYYGRLKKRVAGTIDFLERYKVEDEFNG